LKEQKKAILKKLEEVELKLYEADKENKDMEKKFRQVRNKECKLIISQRPIFHVSK